MKILAFTASLMMSGAALAQATPPPEPAAPAMPAPETPPAVETPTAPTEQAMPAPAAPAAAPAPTMAPMAAAPAPAPQAEYPRCSRTVTDQCIQSSARESDTRGGAATHRKAKRRG